jgi:hypothetical protein
MFCCWKPPTRREENLRVLVEVTKQIAPVQIGNTNVRPRTWDQAPGANVRFDLEPVVRSNRAAPDAAEEVFRRLMAHSAALRAESVAVTGHWGQEQSRVLRAQSAGWVSSGLFWVNRPFAARGSEVSV